MQPRFLKGIDASKKEKLIANQLNVIRCCADYDIPVILIEYNIEYTEYEFESNEESTVEVLLKAVEMIPRREKITKKTVNAFTHPYLSAYLRHWQVDGILLMGVCASACVKLTAEGALGRGFKIATSGDLISDEGEDKPDMSWYRQNGLVFKDSRKTIEALINKENKE
ncbi:MAG: isochorismatase family protein [Candidatus Portnoybacteria bacterium]|nr:isochorismatase family protein [Candidatus Portnoybacteria bacterium]